jgi:hypothetical protein
MALETCFRAWALHAAPAAGGKDSRLLVVGSSSGSGSNLVLPSKRAAAAAVVAPLSVGRVATRRPRHVCQSKNAVDEGNHIYIYIGVFSGGKYIKIDRLTVGAWMQCWWRTRRIGTGW